MLENKEANLQPIDKIYVGGIVFSTLAFSPRFSRNLSIFGTAIIVHI